MRQALCLLVSTAFGGFLLVVCCQRRIYDRRRHSLLSQFLHQGASPSGAKAGPVFHPETGECFIIHQFGPFQPFENLIHYRRGELVFTEITSQLSLATWTVGEKVQ